MPSSNCQESTVYGHHFEQCLGHLATNKRFEEVGGKGDFTWFSWLIQSQRIFSNARKPLFLSRNFCLEQAPQKRCKWGLLNCLLLASKQYSISPGRYTAGMLAYTVLKKFGEAQSGRYQKTCLDASKHLMAFRPRQPFSLNFVNFLIELHQMRIKLGS